MSDTSSTTSSASDNAPAARPLVDLSDLRLMPNWVSSFGNAEEKQYKQYEERESRFDRKGGDRRDGGAGRPRGERSFSPGGKRPGGFGGERRSGQAGSGAAGTGQERPQGDGQRPRTFGDRPRGERSFGDKPRGERPPQGQHRGGERGDRSFGNRPPRFGSSGEQREFRPPLPTGIKVTIEPSEAAVDALAQHVRTQGRAFSVFEGARLVLDGPERHKAHFECEAERLQGLYHVPSDGSLFETREDAVRHLLRSSEALAPYYNCEEVELEEPKGQFTSVAVCTLSGEILGPPSHHSYQTALKRLHLERFHNLPLEVYKKRLEVKNEPELIEKWKEQQKKGQRWIYLKGEVAEGTEPQSFTSRGEMEAHFRRIHLDTAIVEVREAFVSGAAKREQLSSGLGRLMYRQMDDTRKKLFDLAQRLAQGMERRGLKLFKRRAGKMYVSRIKPRAVDNNVVLSDRICSIMEKIKAEPGILASKLIEDLAPSVEVVSSVTPAMQSTALEEAAPTAEVVESEVATLAESTTKVAEVSVQPTAEATETRALTDEQKAVIRDLHWLADEGYIIEYADGTVFIGVQAEQVPTKAKPSKQTKAEGSEVAAVVETAEQSTEETKDEPTVSDTAVTLEESAEAVVETAEQSTEATFEESTASETTLTPDVATDPSSSD